MSTGPQHRGMSETPLRVPRTTYEAMLLAAESEDYYMTGFCAFYLLISPLVVAAMTLVWFPGVVVAKLIERYKHD